MNHRTALHVRVGLAQARPNNQLCICYKFFVIVCFFVITYSEVVQYWQISIQPSILNNKALTFSLVYSKSITYDVLVRVAPNSAFLSGLPVDIICGSCPQNSILINLWMATVAVFRFLLVELLCEYECQVGCALAKNWKMTICYEEGPLVTFFNVVLGQMAKSSLFCRLQPAKLT